MIRPTKPSIGVKAAMCTQRISKVQLVGEKLERKFQFPQGIVQAYRIIMGTFWFPMRLEFSVDGGLTYTTLLYIRKFD